MMDSICYNIQNGKHIFLFEKAWILEKKIEFEVFVAVCGISTICHSNIKTTIKFYNEVV